ncbi:MAG: glycosyltransferase family 2 protein [Bacteriovoracaceae bacterium]
MNYKISVIIPTYNRLTVLSRALESVFAQIYQPFEIIVMDDGSNDETKSYVEALQKNTKIPLHYYYVNRKGVSYSRNQGVKVSQGDWVAFLDSDDEWLPTKISEQVSLLNQNPNLKLIHTEEIWVRNGVRVNQMKKHQKLGGWIFPFCLPLCRISPSSTMMNKLFFNEIGGFREDFEVCEDYDLWLKVTAREQVGYVSDPQIIKYGGHEDQLSQKYHSMDIWRVKSLLDILSYKGLADSDRELVNKHISKKLKILQIGYKKRNKLEELKNRLANLGIDIKKMELLYLKNEVLNATTRPADFQ